MAPGPATPDRAPVVIFDLDNTLLAGNSFHRLVYLLHFRRGRPRPTWRTTAATWRATLRRGVHRQSRVEYKRAVQALLVRDARVGDGDRPFGEAFAQLLETNLDPVVHECFRMAKDRDCLTMLSTGALPEYAMPLGERLDFDVVIATSAFGDDPWVENIGERKREHAQAAAERLGLHNRFSILIADHDDDLPLASACDAVFWHGPGAPDIDPLIASAAGNYRPIGGILDKEGFERLLTDVA